MSSLLDRIIVSGISLQRKISPQRNLGSVYLVTFKSIELFNIDNRKIKCKFLLCHLRILEQLPEMRVPVVVVIYPSANSFAAVRAPILIP